MRKIVVVALVAAVVIGVSTVVRLGRAGDSGPYSAIVEDEIAQIELIAAKKYPDMPLPEAMALVGDERAKARLSKHTLPNQQTLAAIGFSTFYNAHTVSRSELCNKAGVDISAFVSAFRNAHEAELSQTSSIFQANHTNFDNDWVGIAPSASTWVAKDMQELAKQRKTDMAGACRVFATAPDEVVALLTYASSRPDERALLFSHGR